MISYTVVEIRHRSRHTVSLYGEREAREVVGLDSIINRRGVVNEVDQLNYTFFITSRDENTTPL